ncbi:MAG: azurin [Flavobacteriaceae bacterium]|nr:azurin [Flavobacteriaceae bacterium]
MRKLLIVYLISSLIAGCAENNTKKSVNPTNKKKSDDKFKTEIVLNSNDTMKFDQNMLLVNAGSTITLTLNHTGKFGKRGMGHNFVLLKSDVDVAKFALKAAQAYKTEYIPEGDEILAYTKLLGGGESDTITFEAPKKGYYTFICSFPGHWQLMKGKLIVK